MPFVSGWDEQDCPVEVNGAIDFYATIVVKGENLTTDWLSKVVKGAYYNGGNEIETTIGDIIDYGDGRFSVDINFNMPFDEGRTVKFEVDGVQSAWMPMIKAN